MPGQLSTHEGLPPDSVFLNFRKLLDNILTPYMVMDPDLVIIYANKAYLDSVERSLDEIAGKYIFESFPDGDDRMARARDTFLKTLDGEPTRLERQFFEHEHADGTVSTKCWQYVQTPYFGSDDEVLYIVQQAEDITEAVALERRNELIAQELDHRVKNIFAVIQAVAMLSGERAESVDDFRDEFAARLAAMSRTHDQLRANSWDGLGLKDVIGDALEQFCGAESPRVRISGPEVRLSPRGAQHASLLVHELATNAAKYGCLSVEDGELQITITPGDDPHTLMVDWKETGLKGLKTPEREGFGTQLVKFMPNLKMQRIYEENGLLLKLEARMLHPMEEPDTLV